MSMKYTSPAQLLSSEYIHNYTYNKALNRVSGIGSTVIYEHHFISLSFDSPRISTNLLIIWINII